MRITKRATRAVAKVAVAASFAGMSVLGVANPASAAAFNGTPGYFTGDNTPNNTFGGTALAAQPGGTLAYSATGYPGSLHPTSFDLNGSTTLADSDTNVGNTGAGDFAIGLHFKTSTFANNIPLLTKQADCSGNGSWFQIDLANSGVYVQWNGSFNGGSYPTPFTGVTGSGLVDGNWHYVELIRSGDTLFLYIDGLRRASVAYTGNNPSNTAPLRVGGGVCGTTQLTGQISDVYAGAGVLYSLSSADTNPTVPPGTTGGPTLNYSNDSGASAGGAAGMMHTLATAPTGTTFGSNTLTGPGCVSTAGATTGTCQFALTGNGGPITAGVAVPSGAALNTTFPGGNFSMSDLVLPVSPSSTGFNANNDSANLAFSVNTNVTSTPLADLRVAGGVMGGLVVAGGAAYFLRRRRSGLAG
jgi:hypothetical protein